MPPPPNFGFKREIKWICCDHISEKKFKEFPHPPPPPPKKFYLKKQLWGCNYRTTTTPWGCDPIRTLNEKT